MPYHIDCDIFHLFRVSVVIVIVVVGVIVVVVVVIGNGNGRQSSRSSKVEKIITCGRAIIQESKLLIGFVAFFHE